MKVSVITISFNSSSTIRQAIDSVLLQDYPDVEHIFIDGGSTDGTAEIIAQSARPGMKYVSELDHGIYDAFNKGLRLSSGDIVGFLNSDDRYVDSTVVSRIVGAMRSGVDAVFGDVVYVRGHDESRIVRYYCSADWTPHRVSRGWMPAHPTLYVRRRVFDIAGEFDPSYKIAGDFDFVVRAFVKKRFSFKYIPAPLVVMRHGGVSTRSVRSTWRIYREMLRSCRSHGVSTGPLRMLTKYPRKLTELVPRPFRQPQ